MKKEYECSFETKDLSPFINYCRENNYKQISKTKQTRTIYRHKNKTMARITIEKANNKITKKLDFKEDKLLDELFIERRESLPLEFNNDKTINSILEFLEYQKDHTIIRNRIIYEKNNITFELDQYLNPRKTNLVSIEGQKETVNNIYIEIKNINKL